MKEIFLELYWENNWRHKQTNTTTNNIDDDDDDDENVWMSYLIGIGDYW